MEAIQRALSSYQHLDLVGWVALYRVLPMWAGVLCIVAGVLMLFWGGGRLFRLVAAPLGALIGFIWAGPLAVRFGVADLQQQITLGAAIGLAAAGLAMPPAVTFISLGVPCGLLGGQLAGTNDYLLGFMPGFVMGGAIAVMLHRIIAGIVSAAVGGWVLTMGLCAALSPFLGIINTLANNPLTILAFAAFLALVGGIYQLIVRPPPEVREKLKQDKHIAKKMKKERKELEARWAKRTSKNSEED